MRSELQSPHPDYRQWLEDIKGRYRQVQLKAAMVVNTAVLEFYWELGVDIVARQSNMSWGQGFLTQLSADLMNEFPGVSGFSKRNLEQMRRWVTFWSQLPRIAKQPASQYMDWARLGCKWCLLILPYSRFMLLTPHQAKYIAHDLTLQHAGGGLDLLSQGLFNASVDLNPHQNEAAVFALRSPLSKGVLLAPPSWAPCGPTITQAPDRQRANWPDA